MSTKSNPEKQALPNDVQEDVKNNQEQPEAISSAQQGIEAFWQIVRKSADIIVTLRQENEILQSQNQALHKSEAQLQETVQDLLSRVEVAEQQKKVIPISHDLAEASVPPQTDAPNPNPSIDRTEDADDLLEVREEIIRLEAIVEKYRAAGLRHLEEDGSEDQMGMFQGVHTAIAQAKANGAVGILTKEEAEVLADQLDNVADQLQKLFDIS